MNIELVTIGTELLLGFTVDGNGAELGRQLARAGIRVTRRTTVADEPAAIAQAVSSALTRTGAVITTGGLGPTRDDITKRVVAGVFGRDLEFSEAVWEAVVARFARFGRTPNEANRSQAEVPVGAEVLPNRWGTAPGIWLEAPVAEAGGRAVLAVMLPGVPGEMRKLLEHEVLPRLATRAGVGGVIRSRTVRTFGVPESTLAERLGNIEGDLAPLTFAYLPSAGAVDLRVTAWELPADEADRRLDAGVELVRRLAGPGVYGTDDADLAELVLSRARTLGWKLATAESCTAGLVAARLTELPGSSEVFVGGIVAYDNALKESELAVPPGLLREHGAVSEAVVLAMAAGARRLGADLTVAVTGVAGPGGGTPEKPVGTVWIAVQGPDDAAARLHRFQGSRDTIRGRATEAALAMLLRQLDPALGLE